MTPTPLTPTDHDARAALARELEHTTEVSAATLIQKLLDQGHHPAEVRRSLRKYGIVFRFAWPHGDSDRAKVRRLRQQGRGLCPKCRRNSYPLGTIDMCQRCLDAKWADVSTRGISAL